MNLRTWALVGAATLTTIAASIALFGGSILSATVNEPAFTVEREDKAFSIRRYGAIVVAETVVAGTFDQASNEGFRRLLRFISGANVGASAIAMTAPVVQSPVKIAMTAPVMQTPSGEDWVVAFVMPAGSTLTTTPSPTDDRVRLRAIPERRVAVARFSGTWSESQRQTWTRALVDWVAAQGLTPAGEPEVQRYDPPWTLPMLRRNEIHLPLADSPG